MSSPDSNGVDEDTGQFAAHVSDVRDVYRKLTLQNALAFVGVIGALWVAAQVVGAALLSPAIAAHPVVVQHGEEIRELRAEVRSGLGEQRALSIRQLEEQRAIGVWMKSGYKAPILDAPLPPKDAGP